MIQTKGDGGLDWTGSKRGDEKLPDFAGRANRTCGKRGIRGPVKSGLFKMFTRTLAKIIPTLTPRGSGYGDKILKRKKPYDFGAKSVTETEKGRGY